MDQTFNLVGINLVLQVSLLISTMAMTKTAKHDATNKCHAFIVNSLQTRSMVAKLKHGAANINSPQIRSQEPVTDPVIGSACGAHGHCGEISDFDDLSVHIARAAPRAFSVEGLI